MKYLYGAAVQGIQNFIFQTDRLRDVAGASELVAHICTKAFSTMLGKRWKESNQIISAAGNIKYVFNNESDCQYAVRHFPMTVMTTAPGITVSQAVVAFAEDEKDFCKIVFELEDKLRTGRNLPSLPVTVGLLGMERSRHTGLPAVEDMKDGLIDASTKAKQDKCNTRGLCQKSFFGDDGPALDPKRIAYEVEDITGRNDWIAVIHADGNSLGQVVQAVGHDPECFRRFSKALDAATVRAANGAFKAISERIGDGIIPIRPVVLGGDDMTVIIRGDLAIPYVTEYLKRFEQYTGEGEMGKILAQGRQGKGVFPEGKNHLSACAGIAFVKSSYPFHYAYQLAEQLCEESKRVAKQALAETDGRKALCKSCLMFHKVEDSFVTSYADIVRRVLMTDAGKSLKFGPYYINSYDLSATDVPEGSITIDRLLELCDRLGSEEGVKTGIRRWLTLLHNYDGRAGQHLQRLLKNNKENSSASQLIAQLTQTHHGAVAAYDVLTLFTIMNQETK